MGFNTNKCALMWMGLKNSAILTLELFGIWQGLREVCYIPGGLFYGEISSHKIEFVEIAGVGLCVFLIFPHDFR